MMKDLVAAHEEALRGGDSGRIEAALEAVQAACAGFSAAELPERALRGELDALGELYRAVRAADATMQTLRRSSDVQATVTAIYYSLRSAQASISMAYAVAGPEAERPETSPLGTVIGLYDAPKVLAQETHLASGSYDAALERFVWWMTEIREDVRVRLGDYERFYGAREVAEARQALHRMLGLDDAGRPIVLPIGPGESADPEGFRRQLLDWASDPGDLVGAARAIQRVSQAARLQLTALLASRPSHASRFGEQTVAAAESILREVVSWPFPVGQPPIFDLDAEQSALDALLASVPEATGRGRATLDAPLQEAAVGALRRACEIEQSLRDQRAAYGAAGMGRRGPRTFRWNIWELVTLLDQRGGRAAFVG